ncbi:hypothetical protein OV203_05635 [Nannocystis sp. ILAH1]|uniref:hypothetical protein n=1 Tax=Nannocystis sp. ILAH1 TaxID=2996789 RepID=UPI00226DA596|nr:hypothetical protein [Nannocystis sp. ILAH1]MCY0986590.1 hypothetical protein [Nannocystis sp. ILAH1]
MRHRSFAAALALHCIATSTACSDTGKGTDTDATTSTSSTSTTTDATTTTTTGPMTDATTTTSDGTDATTVPGTTTPTTTDGTGDPDYHRECQPGDFVCDGDLGCEDATLPGECYKPCTPDGEVGAADSECDEPERPFCSQVGLADGGDFSCNSCVHICMAEPQNQCDFGADECP